MKRIESSRIVEALRAAFRARGAEEVPIESGGAALEEVRGDFGRIVRGGAQLLVRPRSTLDVRDVVRVANRLGVRVTPRGRGGSTQGQAVARSGIALDLRALNRIALPDSPSGSHVAILEPGGTWDRAIDAIRWRRALSKRYPALQIPLVPGYKKLTVGGTLSVGGGGFRSHTRGLQVDHVCELELVTGAGEIVVASATQNAELFFGSLGGGGQLALITRATTALVPDDVAEGKALASVQLSFDEAEPFLEAILTPRLAERFYEVQGNARYRNGRWSYIIKGAFDQRAIGIDELRRAYPAARLYRNLYLLRSGRHAQLESLGYDLGLKLIRRWRTPHPWATTFLPIEVTAAFFLEQLQRVHRSALGLLGFVTIVPTVSYQRPYSFLQLPRGERFGSFGIFYLPGDRASAEPLWRQLREMQQAADAIGGKAYLSDGLPPTVTDWERHFGDNLERARELKRRYDPGLVLEPLNEAQQELFGGIGSSARR